MVATLPDGDDPDTLAHGGGSAAVDKVLKDAVDVFERKLQLLERKGWLAKLEGRRRALDRLLPTLRAAADPVTRDLYVSRVSEALGVSRESVAREMADRPRREMRPPSAPPEPPVDDGVPRRPRRPGPERDLLRVMVHETDMRERIDELVTDRSILREPDATLFAVLAEAPPEEPLGALLETLAGDAHTVLAELLEAQWGELDVNALVTGAVNRLDARRLERELKELERKIPLATEDEKPALAKRVDTLSREIARLNPGRWNVIRRRRSGAR